MTRRLGLLTGMLLLTAGLPVRGDFIVGISNGGAGLHQLGGVANPAGFAGDLISHSFQGPDRIVTNGINGPASDPDATNNDDYSGPGAGNGNFVNIAIDVFQLSAPMSLTFTVQPATSLPPVGDVVGPAEYFFSVTFTNRLNANGIQPGVQGREIGGFRVQLTPGTTGAAFDAPQNPNFDTVSGGGDPFPLHFNGFITPTLITYGGASGGGGGLGPNNSVTLRFSIDVPGSSSISPPRDFSLTFTANPEPTSLALGALAMTGAGMSYWRRRRLSSSSELLEATSAEPMLAI